MSLLNLKAKNKKASYDYFLTNHLEVGLVLINDEVKLIQDKKIDLTGSYVSINNDEVWLINSTVSGVSFEKSKSNGNIENYPLLKSLYMEATRPRKLLLHKKEIKKYKKLLQEAGTTLILTELYADNNNRIKGTLCVAKGKKNYDKRNVIKERDLSRQSI